MIMIIIINVEEKSLIVFLASVPVRNYNSFLLSLSNGCAACRDFHRRDLVHCFGSPVSLNGAIGGSDYLDVGVQPLIFHTKTGF